MSASQTPPQEGAGGANDPSMEDILASIRRILSEEEPAPAAEPTPVAVSEPASPAIADDVLVLDSSMLVPEAEEADEPVSAREAQDPVEAEAEAEAEAPFVAPIPLIPPILPLAETPGGLLAPEAEAAASNSVGTLVRTLASERNLQVHRGGPTVEDIVREELRPLLKQWLDANLPDLVERLVRAEIERVVHRAMP